MNNKYIIIFICISILICMLIKLNTSPHHKISFFKTNALVPLNRPFCNIYDNNGNLLNITLLSRPFWLKSQYDDYETKVKGKFIVFGISSYQEFPNEPINPKDNYNKTTNRYDKDKWLNMCIGWLHCFRNPDYYLPLSMDKINLSESDFCDCSVNKPNPSIKKKYDFMYICHRDDLSDCSVNEWVAFNKNLELAEKCITQVCNKNKNIKGLLIGRFDCNIPQGCSHVQIETTKKLSYNDLQKRYDESKLLFCPNIHDASPRVITEALSHNIPCLVNKNIVGGWKYIISGETGEFFEDETDFYPQFTKVLSNCKSYKPREYFIKHYGIISSGRKMKNFLYDTIEKQSHKLNIKVNIPKEDIDYICPEFKKINIESCKLKY